MNIFTRIFARRRTRDQAGQVERRFPGFAWWGSEERNSRIYSPEDSLMLASAWRCIGVISGSLSSLPWDVLERGPDRAVMKPERHPLARMLSTEPNPEMTAATFRSTLIQHSLLWGNGFAEIVRDREGRPRELWPISPDRVEPVRDERGMLVYEVQNRNAEKVMIYPKDMFHLRGLSWDGVAGYAITDVARRSLSNALRVDAWSSSYFKNALQPPGVITMGEDFELTPESIENVWASFRSSMGSGSHRPFIAANGMDYRAIAHTPEQAQMLDTRLFLVREVCRWFGVPPYLAFASDDQKLGDVEAQSREFRQFTLDPIIVQLEQEADRKLLLNPMRFRTRIDTRDFTRGDTSSRVELYRELRNMGVATVNDICRWEGLPTIGEEGDHRVMQVQWQPVDPATGAPGAPKEMETGPTGDAGMTEDGGSPGSPGGAPQPDQEQDETNAQIH